MSTANSSLLLPNRSVARAPGACRRVGTPLSRLARPRFVPLMPLFFAFAAAAIVRKWCQHGPTWKVLGIRGDQAQGQEHIESECVKKFGFCGAVAKFGSTTSTRC